MKLPDKLLDDVDYYHYTTEYTTFNINDIVTIHFSKWWRFKKKYTFRRIVHCDMDDNTYYTRSKECVELIEQLRCHLYNEC
jgi:hypothetical protein